MERGCTRRSRCLGGVPAVVLSWAAVSAVPVLLGVPASPAHAHDHWLELTRTATGTVLRHHVGEGLVSELSRPWEPEKAARAQLIGPDGTVMDLRARFPRPGTAPPALALGRLAPGTHVLVLDRRPVEITLEGPAFRAYLAEEGVDVSLARRGIEVDFTRPGRERYARYLKAIVEGQDAARTRAVHGQRLEICLLGPVPTVGHSLPLRVVLDGQPLASAVVFAETRDVHGLLRERLETGPDGRVEVSLSRAGRWLVRLVHMQRCARDCAQIDWESVWGALTFEVRAPSPPATPPGLR